MYIYILIIYRPWLLRPLVMADDSKVRVVYTLDVIVLLRLVSRHLD